MCLSVSNSFKQFDSPQNVKIGRIDYKNITAISTKEFVDSDGRQKVVNDLQGLGSNHTAYVEDGKVIRTIEEYWKPKNMVLGGKKYNNIVSKCTIPDKHDTYSVFSPDGKFNQIRVRKNGSVLDIGELKRNIIKRKFTKPIDKICSMAKNIMLLLGMHYL